ncbi:mCG148181 [Mus musculus]|nr:mCG148181 [Mus musculus]
MRTPVCPSPSRQGKGETALRGTVLKVERQPKTAAAAAQVPGASPGPATPNLQIQFLSLCSEP